MRIVFDVEKCSRKCYNPNIPIACENCKFAPKYAKYLKLKDEYIDHPITCKYGCTDCIYDPGYIWFYYPEWYAKLYGNKPYAAIECSDCDDAGNYDYEDK